MASSKLLEFYKTVSRLHHHPLKTDRGTTIDLLCARSCCVPLLENMLSAGFSLLEAYGDEVRKHIEVFS